MSKRYKGKQCAYCADDASNSGDHVFAREFFPIERRHSLPIVPACARCNNAKSALEHYLTAILPFGGRHPDSSGMLKKDVGRRLAGNQKLHRELAAGALNVLVNEAGEEHESLAVPFDSAKLVELFGYIAKGLVCHHWGVVIPSDYEVEPLLLNPEFEPHFRELFLRDAAQRINGSVGDGAFLYQGAQAVDDPALTIWRFQAFGGVVVAGDEKLAGAMTPTIWVMTGHRLPQLAG